MKNISIILLVIIFTSNIVQSAGTYTCATHPIFLKAKDFLKSVVDGDSNGTSRINEVIDAFSANTPASLSADDLGICSQFAGQQTCCTKKFVEIFDVAAIQSVADIQMNQSSVKKLLYTIKKVLNAYNCGSSASSMTVEDILANPALTNLKAYNLAVQTAKLEFSKMIARINRGALCSVCAGVDKIDTYFVSPKLQVDSANNNQFLGDIGDSYDGLNLSIYSSTLYQATIEEVVTTYIGTCSSSLSLIKTGVLSVYGMSNAADSDSDGNLKCSGKVIFNERPVCDSAQDGDPQVETRADAFTPPPNNARVLRVLADTEDSDVVVGGLKVYVTAPSDSTINSTGDYKVTWPASIVNNEQFNSTTTSVPRIYSLAIALLFLVLGL